MTTGKLSKEELKNLKKMINMHETAIVNVEKRIETEGPVIDWDGKPLVERLETHKEAAKLFNNLLKKHNEKL